MSYRENVSRRFLFCLTVVLGLFLVSGCSSAGKKGAGSSQASKTNDSYAIDEDWNDDDLKTYSDPLQPFNKAMFKVNDGVYRYGARPIAKFYKVIIPKFLRKRVKNVFDNAHAPGRIINSALQGKGDRAGRETFRFLFNTTVGFGGIWDPAKKYPKISNIPEEDTDQTFAAWGVGKGFYLYLPLLGPTSVRGAFGSVADAFMYPLSYIEPTEAAISVTGLEALNDTSFRLGQYEALIDSSLDPYTAVKDAYYQYRVKMEKE